MELKYLKDSQINDEDLTIHNMLDSQRFSRLEGIVKETSNALNCQEDEIPKEVRKLYQDLQRLETEKQTILSQF